MRKKKIVQDPFEPIPKTEVAEWNKLVREGIALVRRRDTNIWKLVLLSGRVISRYGENRIKRFGDEIGLASRTIHEYQWLNRAGVDLSFVDRWSKLNYSMIREVLRHTGKVSNPSTEYFLNYASERNLTVRAMQAFMLETIAPDRMRERASETIKMALQDKQEAEGFSDYIKAELERIAEEHPELEDSILRSAIVDVEDLQALKVAAGLATDDEEQMIGQAKYQLNKIKGYYSHLLTIKGELIKHIEYGHDSAEDLKIALTRVRDVLNEILEAEFIPITIPEGSVDEIQGELYSPLTDPPASPSVTPASSLPTLS